MKIINAKLNNQLVSIQIKNNKFFKITKQEKIIKEENTIDCCKNLILAPFVESHIHLDTTQSAGSPVFNETGTLFEGIRIWSLEKPNLTEEIILKRIDQTIRLQIEQGVQFVRTHVDITDPNLTALKVLKKVQKKYEKYLKIQIIAFPQEGIYSYPNGENLMKEAIKLGIDGLGAIPHFEDCYEYGVNSLKFIFELAIEHDLLIDVHCDEIDDPNSRFLEVLATLAIQYNYGKYVCASHTTAMGSYNDAYTSRLFKTLKKAKINFVANPLVNIHLGGRFDTYPKRRGLTRIKELDENGLNVSFGHDDIFDPWYPLGNANMISVAHMGMHLAHMMGNSDLQRSLDFVSINGAKTLNLSDYGIKEGNPANFIVIEASDHYEALKLGAAVLYSVHEGELIMQRKRKEINIY